MDDYDEDDDSELRVKATITKVINGVRVVEALTKKHGIYKLSINDILGASKYKPTDLTGADIVIVLGPHKKNQRRRDFLFAELSEVWAQQVHVPSDEGTVNPNYQKNSTIKISIWALKITKNFNFGYGKSSMFFLMWLQSH